MLDQLRRIAIFAATVDHGSFRAAAQALRLSPSVVSHHVSQLEDQLGTALLYRSTRKLSLTPDGERMLEAARAMLDAAETGLHAVAGHDREPSGVLRITAPAVLAQSELVTQLAAYSVAHGNVRISLDFSDDRRDLIGDGFDIAIRMGELKDSSLMMRKLFDAERRLVAARSFLDTQPGLSSPADLVDRDWLELAPVWSERPEFRNGRRRVVVSRPPARISVNDAHALFRLTRSGAGLAIVPEFLAAADIASGTMVHVLPDWAVSPVEVFALWPANAPKDGLVRHFVEYLVQGTRPADEREGC
ncbi:MAG: LysR substrate-binding domain-containing protein [Proteobacteria bacterium]|nr:LysR substrate-binding domain-containing protein [Pseudomonadota bacterium]